jgi:hypothetical protein
VHGDFLYLGRASSGAAEAAAGSHRESLGPLLRTAAASASDRHQQPAGINR